MLPKGAMQAIIPRNDSSVVNVVGVNKSEGLGAFGNPRLNVPDSGGPSNE
jgi:hypothetical protein